MNQETIVLGGGCFWCTEAVFKMLKGVRSVEPGYAGPHAPSTGSGSAITYEYVSRGDTPYVEAVRIVYDPDALSFEELLQVFFASHDATEVNRQGNDVGPQYRSAIFYTTESQKRKAQHYIETLNARATKRIATEVGPLQAFYAAEDYHKNYFETHTDAPYCTLIIAPKVEKIAEKFKHLTA